MRVGPAVNVARISVDETITALWRFANALGLLTDDINERTAAAGVTIDGVLFRDSTILLLSLPLEFTDAIRFAVTGDATDRLQIHAGGQHEWGDGTLARDTNLFRAAANLLATDDDLRVGGAAGVLTDDIVERTAAAGVTIDGVRLKDIAIDLLGAISGASRVLGSDVVGDAEERFRLHAGGIMQWGDGTNPRDVVLEREAADELGTPDDFNVGGALDLAGDIEIEDRVVTLAAGDNDDVATGTVTVQRMDSSAGVADITGFAGGRTGRVLVVVNVTTNAITLKQNDAGSVAANRMFLPNAADLVLSQDEALWLYYDANGPIWRALAFV